MDIPILNRKDRKREYEYFLAAEHRAVVEAYLFKGMSFHKIEHDILGFLIPLSTLDEKFEINFATDMTVVYSNCHRMIHRERNNILSIDKLRQIINQNHLRR